MTTSTQAGWLETTVGVRALPERVLVAVRGDDARTWLNGQVTNDVRSTTEGQAVHALVIHVKGRVMADTFVLDRGAEGLAMSLPRQNLDALLEHFEKYIIMEDVELVPDEATAILTVQGPRAADALGDLPGFPCDRLGRGGFDVLVPKSALEAQREALVERARALGGGEVDDAAWELARLRAARPALFVDFGEHTYPQEAGLERVAVSFQKGCYLGQEVVCMLENRGQLNRRLVALRSASELSPGLAIEGADGTRLGEVTSAVRDPESGTTLALGFVKRAQATVGATLHTERGGVEVTSVVQL